MSRVAALSLAFVSIGSAASPPEKWQPVESGCFDQSLHEAVEAWREFPASTNSFRLVGYNGKGNVTFVALDPGLNRGLGADYSPVLIGAYGGYKSTCVTRANLSACGPASQAISRLRELQVPIGYGYEEEMVIRLHWPSYSIFFIDGQGNRNTLTYASPHPIAEEIATAIEMLRECWGPAEDAFFKRHPTMR